MNNDRKKTDRNGMQCLTFDEFGRRYPEIFGRYASRLLEEDARDGLSDNVYDRRPSFRADFTLPDTADRKVLYFPRAWKNDTVLSFEISRSQRMLIVLEKQAAVNLNFRFVPTTETARVCEIFLDPDSSLEISEQHPDTPFSVTNTVFVQQGTASRFQNTVVSLGGKALNRHKVVQTGSGAESHLYGITIAGGSDRVEHHTVMQHKIPHGNSFEHYKTVATGNAVVDFFGQIYVAPDAQQIEAYQQNNNILLSDTVQVTAKPQLEIYADDVKCSHGATFGQLDENALYYMRQRGILPIQAQKLLTGGFVTDLTGKISDRKLREEVFQELTERINRL